MSRKALIAAQTALTVASFKVDDLHLRTTALAAIEDALAEPVPEMTPEWAETFWNSIAHGMPATGRVILNAIYAARAEGYRAGQAAAIPYGWVLVPKVPTQEMNRAAWNAFNECPVLADAIEAAIAAAPTPPGVT
jgi:hypothetical protein